MKEARLEVELVLLVSECLAELPASPRTCRKRHAENALAVYDREEARVVLHHEEAGAEPNDAGSSANVRGAIQARIGTVRVVELSAGDDDGREEGVVVRANRHPQWSRRQGRGRLPGMRGWLGFAPGDDVLAR